MPGAFPFNLGAFFGAPPAGAQGQRRRQDEADDPEMPPLEDLD
jgi:hypothetical protein